jgi:acetaldehyde dehydrogenase/alcohol dehydrogenase
MAVEALKRELDIPPAIKDVVGVSEAEFMAKLDTLADQAFDDQCTGANPRYPLISDLKELFIQAYHGHLPYKIFTNGKGQMTLRDLKLDPQPLLG